MKYLLIILFLSGCCSYPKEHVRTMFANGARNYCTTLWAKEAVKNIDKPEPKYICEDVYNEYYKGF